MAYEVIVVGSGFAGSIFARECAQAGKKVLLLEKRSHHGGNMFDEYEDGVLVQRYGPHSFHTKNEEIFRYLCGFGSFAPYRLTYRAVIRGMPVPCPFNFTAIELLYPKEHARALIERLTERFPGVNQVPVFELLESDDALIREYGEMLFEEDFRPYTSKQWGKKPEEIDKSVIRRVPVLLNYRDSYFDDPFEYQPVGGFAKLLGNMIDHPNITLKLQTDALPHISLNPDGGTASYQGDEDILLVYTGPLDALFGYRFGRLPYRSLTFRYETHPVRDYQETAIVAHPKEKPYTRITEFTKLPPQEVGEKTVIAREYPEEYDPSRGNEPYYPIANQENFALRDRYRQLAAQYKNLILCGRLAEYQYYNMDQVIAHALEAVQKVIIG